MSTTSPASSTGSASLFNLDEEDTTPILVFHLGPDFKTTHVRTTSQHDLCHDLDSGNLSLHTQPQDRCSHNATDMKFERWRVTKKPLPRFTPAVEVKQSDLYFEHEKDAYKQYPTYWTNLASISLPSKVFWSHSLFGSYPELYIVSRERSPSSSEAGSVGSRKISPSSTWDSHAGSGSVEKIDE